MTTAVGCFALAMAVAAILTPLIRNFALRRGLLDHATGGRKTHKGPIPRLGGLAIIVAFYASLAAVFLSRSGVGSTIKSDGHSVPMLFGGGIIALLGLYDDLRGASAKTKLLVQCLVGAALFAVGFRINLASTPFGSFSLGALSFPITMLWIVGVTNAINLIDGLDGLAGGVAFIALATVFAVSVIRPQPFMMLMSGALGGAIVGFLFYNFNPASIFMGDSGSMFLGFMVATSSIHASQKSSTAVAIMFPLIALLLPIADTTLAFARRALRRQPIFIGDREHIHHRFLDSGLSHRQAVIALYGLSSICGIAALTLFLTPTIFTIAAVGISLSLTIALVWTRLHAASNQAGAVPISRRLVVTPLALVLAEKKRRAQPRKLVSGGIPVPIESAEPSSARRRG